MTEADQIAAMREAWTAAHANRDHCARFWRNLISEAMACLPMAFDPACGGSGCTMLQRLYAMREGVRTYFDPERDAFILQVTGFEDHVAGAQRAMFYAMPETVVAGQVLRTMAQIIDHMTGGVVH